MEQQASPNRPQTILAKVVNQQAKLQAAKLGKVVANLSDTIGDISQEVGKKRPSPAVTRIADTVTSSLDSASLYLTETSGEELFRDVYAFAQERPFAAAALAATCGFLAVRLGKVSSLRADS